jgi:hypothetical protein
VPSWPPRSSDKDLRRLPDAPRPPAGGIWKNRRPEAECP